MRQNGRWFLYSTSPKKRSQRVRLGRSMVLGILWAFLSITVLLLLAWTAVIQTALVSFSSPTTTTSSSNIPSAAILPDSKRHTHDEKKNDEPIRIAHAVSLIACHKASRVTGFLDALVILRHSIHQNSIHGSRAGAYSSSSKYSYQMFAFVHELGGCLEHLPLLRQLGYIPLLRPTPVNISAIVTNEFYKNRVAHENCCGDAEFIKLYSYTLTEYPIVVHWDLDTAVLQPMDELWDAMLYDRNSVQGNAARQRLQVQRTQYYNSRLPDRIDAYFTRDITSSLPWERRQGVQGGFVAVRPSLEHFAQYQQLIMHANYTPGGRGPDSGWGGMGYGGFQGAMAYQGVVAFFYDQIHRGHAVELDVCRWNQVVADVIYRGPEQPQMIGQCRQYPVVDGDFVNNTPDKGQCEDCRVLPVAETRTVHFTACKKPWDCTVPYPRVPGPRMKAHAYRLQELTNSTTCGVLFHKYFQIRKEIEALISAAREVTQPEANGDFHPDFFMGYCQGRGRYISMEFPTDFSMEQVYGF